MQTFFQKIKEHKVLLLSLIFFLSSSFTIRLIAAPFTAPATLDPACAPGAADCYVITSSFSTGLTSTSGVVTSNLSTGVSGGQSVVGGTASGNNLTLSSTSNATKGKIVFGTSAYDEVNNRLGIGTVSPAYALSVGSNSYTSGYVDVGTSTGTSADMHITGTYTGTANATYTITVDGGNDSFISPNTIEIKKNGVVVSIYSGWGMDNLPTASPLSLGDGLSVGFDEGLSYYSDHDTGDIWTITATATGDVSVVGTYKIGANFFGSQNVDDGNLYLGKSTSFGVSTGTGNTHVGVSAGTATTTGYQNTLVGNTTGANILGGYANTLIGNGSGSSLTSGNSNTFLGNNSGASIVSGTNNLFLGINATGASTTTNSVALGSGATVTLNNSIAIGASATTTLANQMVIGSSSSAIDNVFIGNGVTTTTAGNVVLNATGGNGSNKAGGNITLAGGKGTGNASGGAVIFSTSNVLTTGTTLQSLTEKMRITPSGNVGIGLTTPTALFQVTQPTAGPGTVSVSAPEPLTVTGVGTQFTNTFKVGDTITVITTSGSESKIIATITSDTVLTTTIAFSGTAVAGTAYTLTGGDRFAVFGNGKMNLDGSFFANQNTSLNNIRLGSGSGNDSITATGITLIGINAGTALTSGIDNTFVGKSAGNANTTGTLNTFVGKDAGLVNTSGQNNTFIGKGAGAANTSGQNNTFIGKGAGEANTTGGINTFLGTIAGNANTTGQKNTFLGMNAGVLNTTGDSNTFVGYSSGNKTTSGSDNVFMGDQSGGTNTTGYTNTFIGYTSGLANTTGFGNVNMGFDSGLSTTTGVNNTYIGTLAGRANITGSYNINLGNATQGVGTASNIDSSIVIGNNGFTTANNQLVVGASSPYGNINEAYFGNGVTSALQTIGAAVHTVGVGIGTVTTSGTYTGTGNAIFNLTIATTGVPQTFDWVEIGGSGGSGSGVSMGIGGPDTQTLADGVTVLFAPKAAMTVGDVFQIRATDRGDFVMNATGGSGTDVTGASLIFAGGKATGSAVGGSLIFKTSDAGVSSDTLQSLTEKMRVATNGDITIVSRDKGTTGATMTGPIFTVGINSNATPAQGSINLIDSGGTARYYWTGPVAGDLCYSATAPLNGTACSAPVGGQTSTRSTKQDIADYNDYTGALDMIINAPLHTFRYKKDVEGYGSDSPLVKTRIGFIADEVSPQFMAGPVIDQVSVNGLLMASIKELNIKLQNISGLTSSNNGGTSVVDQLIGAIVNLKELIADKITTKELCLEDVCINKSQLQQLLQQNNISTLAPEPAVEVPIEVIPITNDTIVTPTAELVIIPEPISEPVPALPPEVAPIPEPAPEPVL